MNDDSLPGWTPDWQRQPKTVPELAAGVAGAIRTFGHYQPSTHPDHAEAFKEGDQHRCCLLWAPVVTQANQASVVAYMAALRAKVGLPDDEFLIGWNDRASTDEVLGVLDQLAEV